MHVISFIDEKLHIVYEGYDSTYCGLISDDIYFECESALKLQEKIVDMVLDNRDMRVCHSCYGNLIDEISYELV